MSSFKNSPNILVIENKSENIAYVLEHMQTTYKAFSFQYQNNIYPPQEEYKIFTGKISEISENIFKDTDSIDVLYNYITEQIEKYDIDTILLDFLLCDSEESMNEWQAQNTIGGKLANKLKESIYKELPIVSFTRIEEENLQKATKTYNHMLFDLRKDFTKDTFEREEYNFYRWINSTEDFRKKKNRYCHIAVVCAMKTELAEIRKLSLQWKDIKIDGKLYYKGKLNNYTIIATSEDKMGMPEAATVTTRMIDIFNPQYVVMTGIAAGINPKEQNFLDLLIPDRVFNWQSGKYKVKNELNNYEDKTLHIFEKDHRGPETFLDSNNIFSLKKDEIVNKILLKSKFDTFDIAKPSTINIFNEGMVSGSAVVADIDIVNDKIEERKIYGIDMEAYGVVFACNNAPTKPKPIIIKAISDFADKEKNDACQPAGMHLSAEAFYVLFNEYI